MTALTFDYRPSISKSLGEREKKNLTNNSIGNRLKRTTNNFYIDLVLNRYYFNIVIILLIIKPVQLSKYFLSLFLANLFTNC